MANLLGRPPNLASTVGRMLLVGVEVLDRVAKPAGLDIGEPFAGYSQNVGALPLPGDRLSKARQWCRALQRQIWATWWAAVASWAPPPPAVAAQVAPGAGMVWVA